MGKFQRITRKRSRSSYKESVISIASLHTETINIWSHLLGTIWFCISAVRFAVPSTGLLTQDTIVILMYVMATAICFACSTLYHVFADHVDAVLWQRIDHFGIACFIWASSASFIFFSFDCQQSEGRAYIVAITSAVLLCLARISKIEVHKPTGRWSCLSTHAALGGLATLPGLHCWYLRPLGQPSGLLTGFWRLTVMNSIGGGIYATRILDRTIERKIGMLDTSHYTMHAMVVVGAWVYEQGLMSVYQDKAFGARRACV
jgi:adiponectin receptor